MLTSPLSTSDARASAASTSPRRITCGSHRYDPAAIASWIVKIAGSSSTSIFSARAPARHADTDSPTTNATGWPTANTSSSAKSGSSCTIAPIFRCPGTSAAVTTARTPGTASAASAAQPRSRPRATGDPTGNATSVPGGAGRSST